MDVENLTIENNGFEDAVNLVDVEFAITNLNISHTTSDAIDIDNGEGILTSSSFFCVGTGIEGGDAIDVYLSNLINTDSAKVTDKAISIGENSKVEIENININHATSTLAVKAITS